MCERLRIRRVLATRNLSRVMAAGYQTANSLCLIDQLVTAEGGGPGATCIPAIQGLYVVSGHCTFYAVTARVPLRAREL